MLVMILAAGGGPVAAKREARLENGYSGVIF